MSADNWGTCPRCRKLAIAKRAARQEEIEQSYGKVPADQYRAMMKEIAESEIAGELDDTLREDYEMGITAAGKFRVIYQGRCEACGFTFAFKHEEQVG